jgi:hypothetical protein
MYSLDPNINTALDRQAQRVRAVAAYGRSHTPKPADQSWLMDDAPRNWGPGRVMKAGMVMAAAVPVALWVVWVLVAR